MPVRAPDRRPAPSVKVSMAGAVRALRLLVEAEMLRNASGGSPAPRARGQGFRGSFVIGHRTKFPEAEIVRLPVRAPDRRTAG